jgi:RNA polymerase sigma-70 factor (ECF subfamily)
MTYTKSITFDEEDLNNAAAAGVPAFTSADEAFLEDLKAGNAQAFDTLISRYSSDVYGLLFRLTQDAEEAADLAQETFIKALRSIGSFRGDAELKTWLFRIAINETRNRVRWWRRRKREHTVSIDDTVGGSDMRVGETLSSASEDPEESLMRRESRKAIEKALMEIPSPYREALVLCDIEGQSYQEIAVTLETNVGTVKSRIARGREAMRQKLKDL